MDYLNFLNSLEKPYKTILYSLVLVFPLAYVDCWIYSLSFRSADILPQIFMAFAISIFAVVIGYGMLSGLQEICIPSRFENLLPKDYLNLSDNVLLILILFCGPSFPLILGVRFQIWWFIALYALEIVIFLVFTYLLRKAVTRRFGHYIHKEEEKNIGNRE